MLLAPRVSARAASVSLRPRVYCMTDSFVVWMLLRGIAGVCSAWVLVGVGSWSLGELARRGRAGLAAGVFAGLVGRTLGAVDTLTVAEFHALSPLRRLGYRLYRHPLIMFALGPVFVFVVQHRWPQGLTRAGWRPWG